MKQTSNAKELFGEIRSCANGATCDLNQLSRWIHEVENDSPGVDAYGYVTHHLGGTPRLWKLLKDQPLDALELLGSLKSPAEYRFVRDILPGLTLEVETIWRRDFEGLGIEPALRFQLCTSVYKRLLEEVLPETSPYRGMMGCLDVSFYDTPNAWATLRDESRTFFIEMTRELERDIERLSGSWDLTNALGEGGGWGFPPLGYAEVSPIAHCVNAFYLLCSVWSDVFICVPNEPDDGALFLFHAVVIAATVKGHILAAREVVQHEDAFSVALKHIVRPIMVQFLEHKLTSSLRETV